MSVQVSSHKVEPNFIYSLFKTCFRWAFILFKSSKENKRDSISNTAPGLTRKIEQIKAMKGEPLPIHFKEGAPAEYWELQITRWARDMDVKLTSFSLLSEGSLAKVFKVVHNKGSEAIKIFYPGIQSSLNEDLLIFQTITETFGQFKKGFSKGAFGGYFRDEAQRETNPAIEFENQGLFRNFFLGELNIIIPEVYGILKDNSGIEMAIENGLLLDEFLVQATLDQRQQAQRLIEIFYMRSFNELGYIHTDPNPGNFAFRINHNTVQLVVYDFGSVAKVDPKQRGLFFKWIQKVKQKEDQIEPILIDMGFDSIGVFSLEQALFPLSEIVLEPFLAQGEFELAHWNRRRRIHKLLGSKRWQFMTSAPITLFPWMRALKGLFYYSEHLTNRVNLSNWIQKDLDQKPSVMLSDQTKIRNNQDNFIHSNTHLHILLKKNGKQKVALEFPAQAVEHLEDLIDDEIRSKLQSKGFSLIEIAKKAILTEYSPQVLVTWKEGDKDLLVELRVS